MRRGQVIGAAALAAAALSLTSVDEVSASTGSPITYSVGTPVLDRVANGPWTLGQGDPTVGPPYNRSLPTYTPGGSPTLTVGATTYPNLAVYPGGPAAASGFTGTPGPLPGYCSSGGPNPESGTRLRQPAGSILPMQPYYFPFVTSGPHGTLLGYFDYRPKDSDEAVVAASSSDGGRTWKVLGQALEQNPDVCPNGNTNDDGQGHPFVLTVPGGGRAGHPSYLYTLDRPTGDTPGSELLVHRLTSTGPDPLAGLPASESVGQGGSTTATAAVVVPAGPGGTGGSGGATLTVGSTANFEEPGRVRVAGATVDCSDLTATATTFTGCTTPGPSPVSVSAGDAVTADPIVPATATTTTGLVAPDGIVGIVPHYAGAPRQATTVLYTEKLLNFFTPTTTTSAVTLPASTIPVGSTSSLPLSGGLITVSLGSSGGVQSVTCTGETSTSLTGCSGGLGTVSSGSSVGAPGACVTPFAELNRIGEGKAGAKSLFGNNQDLTQLRAAWTTDGLAFHDLGAVSGVADPRSTGTTTLRFVGSRGSVIANPDGSETLFLSGAFCSDGDSDAFQQIFTSSSRDGQHWTTPTTLISTDYTFSASAAQTGTGNPLGISAYYSGRVYSPAVVAGPHGSLTMVFAGYRTPKPLPSVGTVLGTDPSKPYTVGATDPALYRNILTATLTPVRQNPPSFRTSGGGILALGLLAGAVVAPRRGRRVRRSAG